MSAPALRPASMNATCMAVKIAAINAANPAQLDTDQLTRMLNMAHVMRGDLKEFYRVCEGDPSLRARIETCGKALKRITVALQAKRGDQ